MQLSTPRFPMAALITVFSQSACVGLLPPPVDPASQREIPAFEIPDPQPGITYQRFLVIGDMGTGRSDQRNVAASMAKRAAREPVSFILTVGDNIYPAGVESVDDSQWRTKFEDVYSQEALQIPFYATLGNHDYRRNVQAQIDYTKRSTRWTMPARYYTFTKKLDAGAQVEFFAIDTTPIAKQQASVAGQLAWLDSALAKSQARWKIVFGHHPLYSHSRHGGSETMITALEGLFVKHKIDLYLAGHDHALEMLKPVKGVHYVISGGAGGPDKAYGIDWTEESFYAATGEGFVACRLSRDELVIEFIRTEGRTQYAHTLTK
jgi:tartrate-resistant acid phosphatase type 5